MGLKIGLNIGDTVSKAQQTKQLSIQVHLNKSGRRTLCQGPAPLTGPTLQQPDWNRGWNSEHFRRYNLTFQFLLVFENRQLFTCDTNNDLPMVSSNCKQRFDEFVTSTQSILVLVTMGTKAACKPVCNGCCIGDGQASPHYIILI